MLRSSAIAAMLLILSNLLQAQADCNAHLDKTHWFYRETQKEPRFIDEQLVFDSTPNSIFPDSIVLIKNLVDTSRLKDLGYQIQLVNMLILKFCSFGLQIMDEEAIQTNSGDIVRVSRLDAWGILREIYVAEISNDSCLITYKGFLKGEFNQNCNTLPKTDFEKLKEQIYAYDFFDIPVFLQPDRARYNTHGAIMDGTHSIIEVNLDGQYHLVSSDNLFDYFPEYNSINDWFTNRNR